MSASRLSISLVCGASLFVLACNKGGGAAKEDLALMPKDAELVIGVNFTRMRTTAMWKKALELGMSQESTKKDFADFSKACGDITSAEGPESILIAMPEPTSGAKDGAALIHLKTAMDEPKLKACLDYMAKKNGETPVSTDYNGKKIWNTSKDAAADKGGITQIDDKTIAFGSSAWVKKIIDLSTGKDQESAKKNDALMALVKRAKATDALWGVGTVPQSARDNFKANPQLAPLASLKAVIGSIDFATGLTVDVSMDTGAETDAKLINDQVTLQLDQAKKMPQIMMMGLGSVFEGLKTEAKGPTFHVAMNYDQKTVDELIGRVQGLLKSFGGALGGPPPGMAPSPMGGAPMGGAPGMGGPPTGIAPPMGNTPPPGMGMKLAPPKNP